MSIKFFAWVISVRGMIGFVRMKIERRARWDRNWRPLDILLREIETVYWHVRGFTVIECFGDSHVKVMRRLNWMSPELTIRFRTISVMGATAYGITNRNSKTAARKIFEKRLTRLSDQHKVFVMLGEIDAGFLVWLLSEKKGVHADEILGDSVDHYIDFVNYILNLGKEIIICSAPLPTVEYGKETPDYLKDRMAVNVPKRERTEMTLKFNSMMCKVSKDIGVVFLDIDIHTIDEKTSLLKDRFLNKSALDHHYDEVEYAKVLKKTILSTGVISGNA